MNTILNIKTKYLAVEGSSKIAYDFIYSSINHPNKITYILVPSIGDIRQEYRLLGPLLHDYGRHNVISVDLRGMGDSDATFKSYSAEDTGYDLVELIKYLDVDNIVLVGCSMAAGSIVLAASKLHYKTIKGLVLLSPFLWDHDLPYGMSTLLSVFLNKMTGPTFWKTYYLSLYKLKSSPVIDIKEYAELLRRILTEKGRMKAIRGYIFSSKKPCSDKAKSIYYANIPVLPIYGSEDPDFNHKISEELEIMKRDYLPHLYDPLVVEGCGHYPHVEDPKRVYESIVEFLNI
mmetsp:Transcript_21995/g.20004  ORF Transcript_21995/g.20004 Transcript_21995/m.20004 type:complete len:289 (+) Transcript_21995:38-904(+)